MILQALYDYYQRNPDLPHEGFEMKEIPFILELAKDGSVVTAPELHFSSDALNPIGGREMAVTAANLTKLVSSHRSAYAVVPNAA